MQSWLAPTVPVLPGDGLPTRLYDVQTRENRPLAPGPTATMYVCGITPYDATHAGHALTYLTYDLLQRQLRDCGVTVRYVQNVTDVDDPLLERALRDGVDWQELAAGQIQLFRGDMEALRILPPDEYLGAVETIDLVIPLVQQLLDSGRAYRLGTDVYLDVNGALGTIAHLDRPHMLEEAAQKGGDPEREGKHDPLDGRLWLGHREGDPSWESPFGPGRPGWHIECTAIALTHLVPFNGSGQIDIQGGGEDLAFPHHELGACEVLALTGTQPFARHVVHTALLSLDGHKMSKSRGNLVFVSTLVSSGVDPMAVRLALMNERYRVAWEWTGEILADASRRLEHWREAVSRATAPPAEALLAEVRRCLADDLDAPSALRAVDAWAHLANTSGGADPEAPQLVVDLCDALLGVMLLADGNPDADPLLSMAVDEAIGEPDEPTATVEDEAMVAGGELPDPDEDPVLVPAHGRAQG